MYAILPSSVLHSASSPAPTSFQPSSPSTQASVFEHQGGSAIRRRVTVHRSGLDTPWGFRLQGGKDFNAPLTVKRVFSGSPAAGHLARDDLILTIDDQPVDDLTHAHVLEYIRSAGLSITLTVETSPLESDFSHITELSPTNIGHQGQELNQALKDDRTTIVSSQNATRQHLQHHTTPQHPLANSKTTTARDNILPRNTYRTSQGVNCPLVATHVRQQPAFKSSSRTTLSSGLAEPGWVPRPKSVPLLSHSENYRPQLATELPEQPACHTAHKQPISVQSWKQEPKTDVIGEEPNYAAWHGSLRSYRSAHPWELKTAKILNSHEGGFHLMREPEQIQSPSTQIYKAEIRDLRLSHPSYKHNLSDPGWEETSEECFYHPHDQVLSAPQTPVLDTFGISSKIKPLSCQDLNPIVQPTEEPVKIQPSVLFGKSTTTWIQSQSPSTKKTTLNISQALQVKSPTEPTVVFSSSQVQPMKAFAQLPTQNLSTPVRFSKELVQQSITKSSHLPVTVPFRPQKLQEDEVEQLLEPTIISKKLLQTPVENFSPVPGKPAKLPQTPLERFNPVPDRPEKIQKGQTKQLPVPKEKLEKIPQTPMERFNPVPDKIAKLPQTHVERFNPVPDKPAKLPQTPVERFNPVPDRPEKLQQGQNKQLLVPRVMLEKIPQTLVECFNPMPNKPAYLLQTPVERFNPMPDSPEKLQHGQTKQLPVPRVMLEKIPQTLVERFNPVPEKPANLQQTPMERFNPVPDRPGKLQQGQSKQLPVRRVKLEKILETPVERFNPVPDKPAN